MLSGVLQCVILKAAYTAALNFFRLTVHIAYHLFVKILLDS